MSQRRACIVILGLALLLLTPDAMGWGPNFWIVIYDAPATGINYGASFSVSGGTPRSDSQSKGFDELAPTGDDLEYFQTSEGSGGELGVEIFTELVWSPSLNGSDRTEISSATVTANIVGGTTSTGTASFTSIGAYAGAVCDETGARVADTSWQTSWAFCGFVTYIDGYVTSGSAAATSTVFWDPGLTMTTTWSNMTGYSTVGTYLVVGVAENVSNDANGIEDAASFKLEIKQEAGVSDTDPWTPYDHSASVGIGMGSLGNNASVDVQCMAHTDVYAVGNVP